MSVDSEPSMEQELPDGWNGAITASLATAPSDDGIIREQDALTNLKSTSCVPDSTDCTPATSESQQPIGSLGSQPAWSCASPGLANTSWFRMAAQCYRVDNHNLRDTNPNPPAHTDSNSVKWLAEDLSADHVHSSSRDWTLDTPRESSGQFSSLVTEIKFDSNSGLTATGTSRFSSYGIQPLGGSYDAAHL
ncbi:unnamed protein product [Echinostoma caproni]|uniref:MAM domain-containing protein n=1 Tax=Echinostoma caproni TaxID=27848 RepID=A0A183APH7_9TREM|nr:unnamed protein product [Echinostoma caproni]